MICNEMSHFFSRKLGVWRFAKEVSAARKSPQIPRGILETRFIILNITVMQEYIIQKVIATIQARWPTKDAGETILIHKDNARLMFFQLT